MFRSEAELVRTGRRVVRQALTSVGASLVKARYEVRAPGVVPDLILYSKRGKALRYVVTVEFKLSNWRKALAQAFLHRNFGNEAYVVLDRAHLVPALEHLEDFQLANVGLLTLAALDGEIQAWHLPEPTLPFSVHFSTSAARSLLSRQKLLVDELPFTRTTRGGVVLAGLRAKLTIDLVPSGPSTEGMKLTQSA